MKKINFTYGELSDAFLEFFYFICKRNVCRKPPGDAEDLIRNWIYDEYFSSDKI